MANTNSAEMADIVAGRKVIGAKLAGHIQCAQGNFEVAAADIDADGDTIKLTRLPVSARILSIKLSNDDLDTGATLAVNVGIYTTGGTIKDEDAFADAYAMQAAQRLTEVIDEAATVAQVALIGDRLWEWAGDASDPGGVYDIVATITAANAGATAGTIGYQILYTNDP